MLIFFLSVYARIGTNQSEVYTLEKRLYVQNSLYLEYHLYLANLVSSAHFLLHPLEYLQPPRGSGIRYTSKALDTSG